VRRSVATAAACAVLAAAAFAASSCASESEAARTRQEVLLDAAETPGAKVVVLEVTESRGRFTVSELMLTTLRRTSGVIEAKRGTGTNEAYAVIEPGVSPETLVLALEDKGFQGKVLQVLTQADIEARNRALE
jgi:hypothetical protein